MFTETLYILLQIVLVIIENLPVNFSLLTLKLMNLLTQSYQLTITPTPLPQQILTNFYTLTSRQTNLIKLHTIIILMYTIVSNLCFGMVKSYMKIQHVIYLHTCSVQVDSCECDFDLFVRICRILMILLVLILVILLD